MIDFILILLMNFIGACFTTMLCIYCWKTIDNKIQNSNVNIKDIIIWIILSFLTSLIIIIPIYFVKIIITIILMVMFNYEFYTKNLNKSIIIAILLQIIIIISEVIYSIICIFFLNFDVTSNVSYINLVNNIGTTIASFVIWKTGYPKKLYNFLIKSLQSYRQGELIITTILMLLVAIISTMAVYLKWNYIIVLSINTVLIIIFVFISIKFASAKNKYNEISNKYETSISSLRQYEAMIDKYRLYNHENKNELQTLRNLISKKNTKALKYIDGILEDKIKDNEKIMRKTFKIPEGGLRAIIYGKLCKMDELGIKYSLDIARDVRTVDLINMDEEIVLNICKILGVFLDNAIEAVKNLKEKQITIEIYLMDGKLCIDITNNFEGKLELDKLDKEKYTTKGKNHGYGLSLVKQIIDDNSNIFENEKSISRNTFTQKLKIKM